MAANSNSFSYPHYRTPRVVKRVREVVDASDRAKVSNDLARAVHGEMMARADVPDGVKSLLVWLAAHADSTRTARQAVKVLQLGAITTVDSMFARVKAPTLKQVLVAYRLALVAGLAAHKPKASVSELAFALGYSSAQSLGRHVHMQRSRSARAWLRDSSLWTEWVGVRKLLQSPAFANVKGLA